MRRDPGPHGRIFPTVPRPLLPPVPRPSARRYASRVSAALGLAVLLAVVFFLAMGALLWWRQERILFQPPGRPWPDGDGARRLEYAASDGQRLFGYVVGDPGPGRPLVVVFHGNADLAGWWVPWAREVERRTGWSVLLAEYRGYAGVAGEPTYTRSAHDARAAWEAATGTLGARPRDVALFGHSLGSAIATELATEVEREGQAPRALLLQSPFTSARAMARIIVARPLLALWSVISRVHFDTEEKVRALRVPVSVSHGERDLLIPVRMGRAVYDAARLKGELLTVPGAGHNDVDDVGGDAYWHWLERSLGVQPMRTAERAAGIERPTDTPSP